MAKRRTSSMRDLRDSKFLKTARERFKLADDADTDQRQRERDDLAFYAGDQWPVDVQLARKGQQPTAGMPAVPARPTLVINKVREPVRQVLNSERASDIGVELVPADDFGDLGVTPDDTEITLREGLCRRIQRESTASDARTWAFARAVQAGRGYYAVMTRYLPGKSWDQEIYIHRIYNQASVLLDPTHEQPDGSDVDWAFLGTWVPWDRFASEYPKLSDGKDNPFAESTESDFVACLEDYPDWYQAEGENKAVRVVDYWYTERTNRELVLLTDGTTWWADELPEGTSPELIYDTRTVVEKQIKFCKIGGGILELERTDWAGPDMPIVKVLGEELQPYDEERRAEGMIRSSRDSQMGFNYMASKQVEVVGLTPIPPLMVDPEAIEQYEPWYQVANTRTLPYLPHRTWDDQGRQLREPHRPPVDPNILPIAQSLAMFDAAIKSTTAVPDPTLGNVDPTLKSGKAIQAVVANAQQSTSNFLDNLARSIRYEGQIINNLLYPIYGKPGRVVRIMNGEGEQERLTIGPPTTTQQPGMAQGMAQQPAEPPKEYKLTKDANFNVIIKVTKSFDSRRTQEASQIADLLSADPQLMTWFGDLFFKNQDGPGHQQMAERAKVMLAPPIQQMLAAKEQGQQAIPPQIQQQLAQMQEQIKAAEAAMSEMNDILKTKQIEQQGKIEIERLKAEVDQKKAELEAQRDLQLQIMKDATTIRVAEINAQTKGIQTGHEIMHEAQALNQEQAHEAAMADAEREHQAQMAVQGLAHQAAMGDVSHQQAMEQGEQGQAFALEQQANQPIEDTTA